MIDYFPWFCICRQIECWFLWRCWWAEFCWECLGSASPPLCSLTPELLPMASLSSLGSCPICMVSAFEEGIKWSTLFKPCLLISLWKYQIPWLSLGSVWEGATQKCGYQSMWFLRGHNKLPRCIWMIKVN